MQCKHTHSPTRYGGQSVIRNTVIFGALNHEYFPMGRSYVLLMLLIITVQAPKPANPFELFSTKYYRLCFTGKVYQFHIESCII